MTSRQAVEFLAGLDDGDRRLVRLVCAGLSDREIAERTARSEQSVHERLSEILQRVGASSRIQLVISAIRAGL